MLGGLKTGKFDAIMAVPAWQFVAEDDGYGKAIYDVASLKHGMKLLEAQYRRQ